MTLSGPFLGPIFGIMIIDYYLIKDRNLINKEIFSLDQNSTYFYSNGWNIKAIYSLLIGFIFAASTIWNENLINLHSFFMANRCFHLIFDLLSFN